MVTFLVFLVAFAVVANIIFVSHFVYKDLKGEEIV